MEYEVIRSSRRSFAAQIKQSKLIIRAPLLATDAQVQRFIRQNQHWIDTHLAKAQARQQELESVHKLTAEEIRKLAKKAKTVIPERVAWYAPLVGVSYGRITIRTQRSRWGSCSGKGNLNFNCLLMLTPPEVLDSVVVHELCHRKEMNHSDRFYAEVLRVFPDYRDRERWLKEHGDELMAMLGD